jgi:hypothetical protein
VSVTVRFRVNGTPATVTKESERRFLGAPSLPAAREEQGAPASAPATPTMDIFDLLRELRGKLPPPPDYKKRMVAAAPVISCGPTSGFGIGCAGNVAFDKGVPKTTRISSE